MYTGSLDPTTTREDWSETFEVFDSETDDPIDLTGAVIVVALKDKDGCAVTTATTAIVDIGVYTASLTASQMRALYPQTYRVGCTLTLNGITKEYFLGTIPVLDGVVS